MQIKSATPANSHEVRFFGLRMVVIGFLGSFATYGVIMAVIGNFVGPIGSSFDVPPTTIGMSLGIAIVALGVLGPLVGRAVDSGYTRLAMTTGALLIGCGFLLLARASTFGELVFYYLFLIAPGMALCGPVTTSGLITSWYTRKRGLMIGLTLTGPTFAMWVGPYFVESIMEWRDWRAAMSAMGAVVLAMIVPLYGLFVIARPEKANQFPDGERPKVSENQTHSDHVDGDGIPQLRATQLLSMPSLWVASVGLGLVLTSGAVLIPLLILYADTELGIDPIDAVHFYLVMIPFSILGKIVMGRIADVAPLKPALLVAVLLNLLVWIFLALAPGYLFFILIGAVYGLGFGGFPALQQILMGRLFGRLNFGRASGIGGAIGMVLIAGANFGSQSFLGATGSYMQTFLAQITVVVLGGVFLALLKIPAPKAK